MLSVLRSGSRIENQDWEGLEGDTRIGKGTPEFENVGQDWEGDIRIGMRENQDCEESIRTCILGLGKGISGLCRWIS
jgi:hypothetical protein